MNILGHTTERRAFRRIVFGAVTLALAGCSTTANLYPTSGPYSQQVPTPVVVVKVEGITGNTGPASLVLPNGETCQGQWSSVAPTHSSITSGSLWSRYGALAGFSVTNGLVPGVNKGQAFLNCSKGTKIEAEFFTGSGTANGYGVATDTAGNVYKMLF
jgi:hypothetical protein